MTTVISFDDWVRLHRVGIPQTKEHNCPECDSRKTETSQSTKKTVRCHFCRGAGLVSARKLKIDPRPDLYVNHVADELKRYCHWSKRDFLQEMGDFLSRLNRTKQAWSV